MDFKSPLLMMFYLLSISMFHYIEDFNTFLIVNRFPLRSQFIS